MTMTKSVTKTKITTYIIVATILVGTMFAATAILVSKIVAKPNPLAFGDVTVNTIKTLASMATNTASTPRTIKKIVISNSAFTLKSTSTCKVGKVLDPKKACSLITKFSPTVTGSKSGTIKITDNKGAVATLKVNGRGIAVTIPTKKLTLSPTALTFDPTTINSSQTKEITVTNTGTALLTLSGLSVSGNGFSLAGTSTCASGQNILEPNGSCKVAVKFSPTAAQNYTGSLTMNTDSTTNPSYKVNLNGSGVGGGIITSLTASPTSVNFGSVAIGTNKKETVTVTNSGTQSTIINSIVTFSPFSWDASSTCTNGKTLAPNDTCNIVVVFTPTEIISRYENLMIYYAGSSMRSVSLTGSGINSSSTGRNVDLYFSSIFAPSFVGTDEYWTISGNIANYGPDFGNEYKVNLVYENSIISSATIQSGYTSTRTQTYFILRGNFSPPINSSVNYKLEIVPNSSDTDTNIANNSVLRSITGT